MDIEIIKTETKEVPQSFSRLSGNKFNYIWLTSTPREQVSAQEIAHIFKTGFGYKNWGCYFHFAVGDDGIFESIPLSHTLSLRQAYRSEEWKSKENGIVINMCARNSRVDSHTRRNGTCPGWFFGIRTQYFAARLIANLMQEYSIPLYHIKRYSEFAPNLYLPAPFYGAKMVEEAGCSRTEYWHRFLKAIKQEQKNLASGVA